MLNLSEFVGSEIMTVLHVDGREETTGWGSIIYNKKLCMLRPEARLAGSEYVVAYDEAGRPFNVGEVRDVPSSVKKKAGQVYARLPSCETQWYSRGRGPGQVEFARRELSVATLTVVGRGGEAKVVHSYIPEVKVGDAVVVRGDQAAMRAPAAPMGRIVLLHESLPGGRVRTVDDGRDGIAILGGGLTVQKNKNAILDFTGNVIVEILDR